MLVIELALITILMASLPGSSWFYDDIKQVIKAN